MTVFELIKSENTPEELAELICRNDTNLAVAFEIGHYNEVFDESKDCPYDCKYLEKNNEYECESYNGFCREHCNFWNGKTCSCGVNRRNVVKKQILEWLREGAEK